MQDVVQKHYQRLADNYDGFLYYSDDFVRTLTSKMIKMLQLQEEDILADIGCGTGMYSLDMMKQVRLRHPVIGVDPFPQMLAQIPTDAPIERIAMDALAFSRVDRKYDKVLIKETVHHVESKEEFFSNLKRNLKPGGILLLVHVPPKLDYPLFKKALERCERWHADPDDLVRLVKQTGFHVERDAVDVRHTIPKEKYFQMVKGCYMSVLTSFQPDELQEGLDEMARTYHERQTLEFTDHFDYIAARKD